MLVVSWYWLGIVLVLRWCCVGVVLIGVVLVLYWCCIGIVLWLHRHCNGIVLLLSW